MDGGCSTFRAVGNGLRLASGGEDVPTLRITQQNSNEAGHYRVEVAFDTGDLVRTADSAVSFNLTQRDRDEIRWYLEEYLHAPTDPAPAIASRIERRVRDIGRELFAAVFPAGSDSHELWVIVRDVLRDTRVEIFSSVDQATSIPWELIRDTRTDDPVSLRARSFVRGYRRAVARPFIPSPTDTNRILLVICRPGGAADVPFRSVAGQLVKSNLSEQGGVVLDVLRPATFAALARVLRDARDRGEPYRIVHFDGHGTYEDVGAPHRPGAHGYLMFERPDLEENIELIDGIRLGSLLAETQVALLVLNACKSAHAGVAAAPIDVIGEAQDSHARIRAYGSLAQEVMDAGVTGVVAMSYNIYVVTAARFVGELYQTLLEGYDLGRAVTRGRQHLADDPAREFGFEQRTLQDWQVPIVYEATPLTLFHGPERPSVPDLIPEPSDTRYLGSAIGLPPTPDLGFYGRDETLLALDRAFDANNVVLLHAFAGSGKTSTAAEFARWYQVTGGLAGPTTGAGPVIFTSFEHYRPIGSLLNDLWAALSAVMQTDSDQWFALDGRQRRALIIRMLGEMPALLIWDNIEQVGGFPAGTDSSWSAIEVTDMVDLIRELRRTRAKLLITSRRPEEKLLGDLPTRVQLPPMPLIERFQLARAIAARMRRLMSDVEDWRPLLEFTAGNPLTVTVLVKQALQSNIRTMAEVKAFVEELQAGAREIVDDQDQGRSKSLGASLSYGFTRDFNDRDSTLLALVALYEKTINPAQLASLSRHEELSSLSADLAAQVRFVHRDEFATLLARAADIGLLNPLSEDNYSLHPALPWYFHQIFATTFGDSNSPDARTVKRAFVRLWGEFAEIAVAKYSDDSRWAELALTFNEANLLAARRCAIGEQWWDLVILPTRGLQFLYDTTGRDAESARLSEELVPYLTDPRTGLPTGPEPELISSWLILTEYRIRNARRKRDWPTAERLLRLSLEVTSPRAIAALAIPAADRSSNDGNSIRSFGVDSNHLGMVLQAQRQAECIVHFERTLSSARELGNTQDAAMALGNLANAYVQIDTVRNLDEADRCLDVAYELFSPGDAIGRGKCISQRIQVARARLMDSLKEGVQEAELVNLWSKALEWVSRALAVMPSDAPRERAIIHHEAGELYLVASQYDEALDEFRQAIRLDEDIGNLHGVAVGRVAVARTLAAMRHFEDAELYAQSALEWLSANEPILAEDVQRLLEKIQEER
jgi:tetratricopeptide (TPR) repeat protein